MSDPRNTSDKDFIMSDGDVSEDSFDHDENEMYESDSAPLYKKSLMPTIIAAVGFFILVILSIAVLSKTQNLAEKEQMLALTERLEQLERRLGGMENMKKQKIVTATPDKQTEVLAERLERLEANVTSKIDQVITALQGDDRTAVQKKAPEAKIPPASKKEKAEATPTVHKVQAGDTLYRISRQYGLSVDQLRTYNKLEPNANIYPGQELKLVP